MPYGIEFLVGMYDTVDELDKFIYLQISFAVAKQIKETDLQYLPYITTLRHSVFENCQSWCLFPLHFSQKIFDWSEENGRLFLSHQTKEMRPYVWQI
jgi:hypothetical protein